MTEAKGWKGEEKGKLKARYSEKKKSKGFGKEIKKISSWSIKFVSFSLV